MLGLPHIVCLELWPGFGSSAGRQQLVGRCVSGVVFGVFGVVFGVSQWFVRARSS